MAGFSIVLLTLLIFWPGVLVVTVLYLAFEAAALVLTSPAFPAIVGSVIAATVGTALAARIFWRHYKDPEDVPLTLRHFAPTFVLYGLSFVLVCVAVYLAGVALVGLLPRG